MWTLSCGKWDLVPRSRMEPRPLALGVQSLSHWTTREVPSQLRGVLFFFFPPKGFISTNSASACMLSHFSRVWLFATPWTVAPGSSVQVRLLEWVAIPSSRGIFPTQGSNPGFLGLLHCRWGLYHWATREALTNSLCSSFLSASSLRCPCVPPCFLALLSLCTL